MLHEVDAHFLDEQYERLKLNFGDPELVSAKEHSMYKPVSNDFIEQGSSLRQRGIPQSCQLHKRYICYPQ